MNKTKNVEALEQIVSNCSGYGGYNPGSPNLTIQSLNNLLLNAKQAVDDANVAKSILAKVSNEREVAFEALPKLASSIIFTLIASGASEQTLSDARYFLRKLTGRKRVTNKPASVKANATNGATEEPVNSRSPQTSYVNKADHFGNLIKLVSAQLVYAPNEAELKTAGLNEKLMNIQRLNASVIEAKSMWGNKKMARDKMLYAANSVVATGRSVQKYVRAAYGLRSAEYRQISKLKFTKPTS